MIGLRALVFVIALSLGGAAGAEPACRGIAPLPAGHPRPDLMTDTVGLSLAARTLSVWPLGAMKLNSQAGVELTFAGGRSCFSTFAPNGRDGIRLDADQPVTTVELAVCDAEGGMCVPVRVVLRH